jgi:hypothetical protein
MRQLSQFVCASKLRGSTKRIVDTHLKIANLLGGGDLWRTTRVWIAEAHVD